MSLQGSRYVWNRTQLMQASQDPSVTHLMGNDPHFLTWHPSDGLHWCTCAMTPLTTHLMVTTGSFSLRPL
jgi:hypothetical protein